MSSGTDLFEAGHPRTVKLYTLDNMGSLTVPCCMSAVAVAAPVNKLCLSIRHLILHWYLVVIVKVHRHFHVCLMPDISLCSCVIAHLCRRLAIISGIPLAGLNIDSNGLWSVIKENLRPIRYCRNFCTP